MNKKALGISLEVLLNLVGFPILLIVAIAYGAHWYQYGIYGATSFAGVLIVAILWALVAGIQFGVFKKHRRKGTSEKRLEIKLMIIPILVIVIFFGFLDAVLPPVLNKAASGTIKYEDVVDDVEGMSQKFLHHVNDFKRKNNLDAKVTVQDEEFQNIFKPIFASMDQAYKAFDQLAIEIALDGDMLQSITSGKLPLSVAVTLLLRTTPATGSTANGNNHNSTISEIIGLNILPIGQAILKIVGTGFDFSDTAALNDAVNQVLVAKKFDGIKWNIFQILGDNMLFPDIDPNGTIVRVNEDGTKDEIGACIGYQYMAWTNSLGVLGAVMSLISIRKACLIMAAIIALLTVLQLQVGKMYKDSTGKYMFEFAPKKLSGKDALKVAQAQAMQENASNVTDFAQTVPKEKKPKKPKASRYVGPETNDFENPEPLVNNDVLLQNSENEKTEE